MNDASFRLRIFDNPTYQDRYTVVYDDGRPDRLVFVAMNSSPFDPVAGICKHGEVLREWLHTNRNSEILYEDLPEDCQKVVQGDLQNITSTH